MKSFICTLLLLTLNISSYANYRNVKNADFKMQCDTNNGSLNIYYSVNQNRSQETALLTLEDSEFVPNMSKTFFSHTVSPYKNPITGLFQYMYHGSVQFQSDDGSVYGRAKFYLDQNLPKGSKAYNMFDAKSDRKMDVSLSLRQNKKWISFKGLCNLSYTKL